MQGMFRVFRVAASSLIRALLIGSAVMPINRQVCGSDKACPRGFESAQLVAVGRALPAQNFGPPAMLRVVFDMLAGDEPPPSCRGAFHPHHKPTEALPVPGVAFVVPLGKFPVAFIEQLSAHHGDPLRERLFEAELGFHP